MDRCRFVLVDVDTQNDFLEPRGSLYMAGAADIIPNLERLFCWAVEHKVPVISTVDTHVVDDPEFQAFPPHCVVGTWGHQKIPATTMKSYRRCRSDEGPETSRGADIFREWPQIIFEKQTVDVFDNAAIEPFLLSVPAEVHVVCGVATDYCVKAMADKLLDHGRTVWLVVDAIAAVDPSRANALLPEFAQRGARCVTTEAVISGAVT